MTAKHRELKRIVDALRLKPGDTALVSQFAALVRSFTPTERIELRDVLKEMLDNAKARR